MCRRIQHELLSSLLSDWKKWRQPATEVGRQSGVLSLRHGCRHAELSYLGSASPIGHGSIVTPLEQVTGYINNLRLH